MVAMKRTDQMLVMIRPIGKIRIDMPGTTKGASEATTRVWIGGMTLDWVGTSCLANTPFTKVASLEEREVLTEVPVDV